MYNYNYVKCKLKSTYIIDVALTDELNIAALSYVDPQVVSVSTAVLHKQFHTHTRIRSYMNHGSTGVRGQALGTASSWNVKYLLVAVTEHLQSAKGPIIIEMEIISSRRFRKDF